MMLVKMLEGVNVEDIIKIKLKLNSGAFIYTPAALTPHQILIVINIFLFNQTFIYLHYFVHSSYMYNH